jgi:methionine-rich copper-binding protein CopC
MQRYQCWPQLCCALLLSLALSMVVGVGTAAAHAKVIDADPKIGSTISQAPTRVTVFTAENINPDPRKSNLFVYGPDGELISQGNATIPLNNPREMWIAIKPDGNGVYIVRWITVSAEDGDPDEGAFIFTVQPAGANSSPARSTVTSGTQPTQSGAGQSNLALWIAIAAVAGLIVGGGAGLGIARSLALRTRGPRAGGAAIGTLRRQLMQEEEKDRTSRR